jgi:hypothetical protein
LNVELFVVASGDSGRRTLFWFSTCFHRFDGWIIQALIIKISLTKVKLKLMSKKYKQLKTANNRHQLVSFISFRSLND